MKIIVVSNASITIGKIKSVFFSHPPSFSTYGLLNIKKITQASLLIQISVKGLGVLKYRRGGEMVPSFVITNLFG